MAQRKIIWTATAAKQRREILDYWTKRNKSTLYSEKLLKLISARVKIIAKHPVAFVAVEYTETRTSAMGHFSIFYKLTEKELIVTAFWDNRQDPKKLLKIIKPNTD